MEALSELETRVLEKLLDGDQPVLAALRGQFAACRVHHRDFTGVGFVTELHVPEDVPSAPVETTSVRFGDVVAELRGIEHGVGFVLFIERGRMIALEAYTFDEPWPAKVEVEALRYEPESRDFSVFEKAAPDSRKPG